MAIKRVIVEPHPDDAFLSLGGHIEKIWNESENLIVSVYADQRRSEESRKFADAVGAGYLSLGLEQSKMLGKRGSPIEPGLNVKLAGLECDILYLPVGLQHPDHLRVSRVKKPDCKIRYYVDTPYQLKQKNREEISKRIEGMQIDSIYYPSARKYRHSKLYKSQAKFFHFNPIEKLRTHEMVLKKPQSQ